MDTLSEISANERKQYLLKLGDLIAFLEEWPNKDDPVWVKDVAGNVSGIEPSFDSYRGYYEDLALNPGDSSVSVKNLLREARWCVGKTFHGYKGGNFTMNEYTPLWIADYGNTGPAALFIEADDDGRIFIRTKG